MAMEIETDQQIGAQAHALPTHEHQGIVVPQDKGEHGEHEQVEISEEAVVAAFVRHVSGGIDMDERAHAGDKQQPDGRERIKQEAGISVELSRRAIPLDVVHGAIIGAQPGVDDLLEGLPRIVVRVSGVLPNRKTGEHKCQRNRAYADRAHGSLLQFAAEEEHDGRTEGREQRDEPDVVEEKHFLVVSLQSSVVRLWQSAFGSCNSCKAFRMNPLVAKCQLLPFYHFIKSTSSMFTVSLFLKNAIRMPRPTAASAAASV